MAIKVPVKAATTANITLSGEQTIDGTSCVTGDRVLVWQQTSGATNGIYTVDTGAWTRALDFDGNNDVTQGTIFKVINGSTYAGYTAELTTSGTITIGTTSLSFTLYISTSGGNFTNTLTGSVPRTIQDKLQDTVHIFDFMTAAQIADARSGNASLDLTVPIQTALNNFNGTGRSGFTTGELLFDGVCKITSPLWYVGTAGQSLIMRGGRGGSRGGPVGTALKWGGSTATSMFIMQGANNCLVERINFVDPAASLTNVVHITADNIWNTTFSLSIAAGAVTATPVSMSNITTGTCLSIGTGSTYEIVYVTGTTGTTFNATFLYAHSAGEQIGHGAGSSGVSFLNCHISVSEGASTVGILVGNVTSSSTMQVSETQFRKISLTGNNTGGGSGLKFLTGGNVKNHTIEECNFNILTNGVNITATSGAYYVKRCEFSNIVTADIVFGQGFLTVEGCECEDSGAMFISGTSSNNPGAIVAINNAWQSAAGADDVVISCGGALTLIGNQFNNSRTGSSIPKIKVNDLGFGGNNFAHNVTSIGNFYQHAQDATGIFLDSSSNTFDFSSQGINALALRLTSIGDTGGATGAMRNIPPFVGCLSVLGSSAFINSQTSGLTNNAIGRVSQTYQKVTVPYTVLTAAALSQDVQLWDLSAKTKVVGIYADVTTAFAGITGTITIQVGMNSATWNDLLVNFDAQTAVITRGLADADLGAVITRAAAIQGGYVKSFTGDNPVKAKFQSAVGNFGVAGVTSLTQGSVTFYLLIEKYS
jgi:hypothetical protein